MRALLHDARYRKWHSFDLASIYAFKNAESVQKEIWRCFGDCYFDDECFRNYRYKKRSERQCSKCPARNSTTLKSVLTPELTTTMLDLVDTIRSFYQVLIGLSKEKVVDRTENFRLRAYHTMILLSARMASSEIEDGVVKTSVLVEGPRTLRELWRTLLWHIEKLGRL